MNYVRRKFADRVLPKAHGIRTVSKRVKDSLVARYGNTILEPTVIPVAVDSMLPPRVPLLGGLTGRHHRGHLRSPLSR